MTTYTPENILITEAAGFFASHVANRLIRNYPVLSKFKFVKGDIGSPDLVNYLLVAESIDTIMHFADQAHVDNSFGNSFEFTKNNIYGTHVLLEACKVTGQIRRFIHVSTDEVYGETDEDAVVGNHEASQLLPTNPYSATKAGAEVLVMAYGRSYGLPVITTRGNNVYGPNQFPEKLIPKFILLAMRGETLPIHGDGSNVRSYLYCEDVAQAFEVILHKGEVGHVYNIGTKKERRVIDVAKDICILFSMDPQTSIKLVDNRPFNDQRYFLDDQKLKVLGWSERTVWEEGLKKTIEWYTKNANWWGNVSGALLPHPRMLMMPGGPAGLEPTHVFNAAGVTGRPNVDWCESHKTQTIRTNVAGTLNLADVCTQHRLLMMNFATGCIFEYNAAHPQGSGIGFKEEENPNFIASFYSKTKAMTSNADLIRPKQPTQLRHQLYSKLVNIPNSMTILDELLPISIEMAKRNLRGVWNFTNPGVVSHNEILEMYKTYINPKFEWVNFTLEEQAKVIVAPRSNNEMDASKLKKEFPELLPIEESLISMSSNLTRELEPISQFSS
ncbi:Trifunctional UDP-glucose 4,6-dehydratase/UDP-4-keto-6-deoxy-D-glucose 3,5-epimerase/UDP-4-keto-L-rhamnose-reductase RHM1 [Hibiscus syriacus]|uniref:Trifunctional UDP-glucose 4,6-dehydratase/UDP-4-keto-6-deoxy-D-glucose 3,5-epimerase/UDP-4-keto-L-rhamnose-reductase RHM1 n=1 Tax=Hibiscus syriacus TaxID=106335 RepID=A0A6A2YCV1_HIBSY|nr:Trifunctional UDP-glucose 4,6-dehydratase/UDP-4-keto-6-deoxy-D-glucose 3,5-epimerase/UDP-4-keto-L-rhamnose-reductase RHM1 [Hibiscus syriacus]